MQLCLSYIALLHNIGLSNVTNWLVFKSVFVSILTYDHESWVMSERAQSQMQVAEMESLPTVHGMT